LQRVEDFAEIEFKFNVGWNDIKDCIVKRLGEMFHDYPYYFFTEQDIHSLLCDIANEELQLHGITPTETNDGHEVNLVHHEYPTPFRCDMNDYRFEKKDKPSYRRGRYDLVILNPTFVRKNSLDVVCANNFSKSEASMKHVDSTPLIWVCEVVFFPKMRVIPNTAILQIRQDSLKVKETLRHRVGAKSERYCITGSVLVFSSHNAKEAADLKKQVEKLEETLELEIILTTA